MPSGTLAVLAQRLERAWLPPRPRITSCGRYPLAAAPPSRTTDEAEDRTAHDPRRRNVAHRHHGHPSARSGSAPIVHAVIDNFSRRILASASPHTFTRSTAWPCCSTPVEARLLGHTPVVLADAGVENMERPGRRPHSHGPAAPIEFQCPRSRWRGNVVRSSPRYGRRL